MALYSFLRSLQARNNTQVLNCLFATLKSVNMCNFPLWEVKLSLSRWITSCYNEYIEASMVQLNVSYTQTVQKATPWTCQPSSVHILHNSFMLSPLPFAAHFPVQEGPYITVYNTSATTVVNFFSLSHSLSSGVPSGCPEHMCSGLPRVETYLSPGWEQTAGFVCGTINQLSFNKNRKPDERQREETWGVGPYLGRKKRGEERRKGKKEGREKRKREGGMLDPDPGLQ